MTPVEWFALLVTLAGFLALGLFVAMTLFSQTDSDEE
jgi:hypothetical protein